MLKQRGESTVIDVFATKFKFGDTTVKYDADACDPKEYGNWIVFFDDPTMSGGKVAYQWTRDFSAVDGRIFMGSITTKKPHVAAA